MLPIDAITALTPSVTAAGEQVLALGPDWLDPDRILHWFGPLAVVGVLLIVFAETGLLVGFFLPGDSLLFTAGMLAAQGFIAMPIWLLVALIFLAAFAGDQVGYQIGRKAGPRVFNKPDSKLFRQEYVDKTYAYFERYGGRTIILARFVPIVRTFAPVAAGVGRMPYRTFVTYNVIGALLWGVGVTLLGYALGNLEFVKEYIEFILIGIVLLSVVPVIVEVGRGWLAAKRGENTAGLIVEDLAVAEQSAALAVDGDPATIHVHDRDGEAGPDVTRPGVPS